MPVLMEQFGKDHWSLVGYVGCRVSSNDGILGFEHMRCHPDRHPHYLGYRRATFGPGWSADYSTRIAGYFETEDEDRLNYRLDDHDDWDCLQDLEAAGLIEIRGTGLQPFVVMTDYGFKIEARLRKHKARGGSFNNFHKVFMDEHADLKRPKELTEKKASIILDVSGEPIR